MIPDGPKKLTTEKTKGEGGRADSPGTVEMKAGKIQRLSQGEDIQFAPGTNRPSGAFMALVQVMVREIASGLNMPYGFLYDMTAFVVSAGGEGSEVGDTRVMPVFLIFGGEFAVGGDGLWSHDPRQARGHSAR